MKRKNKLEWKVYYHSLIAFPDGLVCFGSNEPGHPEGSCLNSGHPLVSKSNPKASKVE